MSKSIVIGTSALLLTFRCNLQCKLCCTTTPQMPQELKRDFLLDDLKAVLKRYFEVVSYIRKLSFGGGEPTLHHQLPELIEYVQRFKNQFEVFEIITNGAAIPREEILDTAEKYRDTIFFMIDHYGNQVSKHADELSDILTKRGIRHKVRCYHGENAHEGGWVDLGDFTLKHNGKDAHRIMKSCVISGKVKDHTGVTEEREQEIQEDTFFIPYAANTNGLIHRCARAYSTLVAGAVENTPESFIDIMDKKKSDEELRQAIQTLFLAEDYPPCQYCNGFDSTSKRYEPAEQIGA